MKLNNEQKQFLKRNNLSLKKVGDFFGIVNINTSRKSKHKYINALMAFENHIKMQNTYSVLGVYRASGRPTGHTFIEGTKKECQQFLEDECGDNDLLHQNYALVQGTLESNTYQDEETNMMYFN